MILDGPSWGHRHYPFVVIGTGFGALFFVHRLLERRPAAKVLMLERGSYRPWETQIAEQRNADVEAADTYRDEAAPKRWNFAVAYGGGTNCWYGTAPRMHPNDFRLESLYGRGRDWPLDYDEIEPYYAEAEAIMDISGPDDIAAVCPRSRPFPQPPHRLSAVDRVMKEAQPQRHFAMPTGRARRATDRRAQCCASLRCDLCPVEAKFTVHNGFRHITEHPNVHILVGAEARELERIGGIATAVRFVHKGREARIGCDFCVLGAGAIHSAAILARSSIEHPLQGRGLNEQLGFGAEAMLDGLDNFDGSTITTGVNYALYDGSFRALHGGAFLAFENRPLYGLRRDYGRWRQLLVVTVNVEDELLDENFVTVDDKGDVVVHYARASDYAIDGARRALDLLPEVLSPLPVESIAFKGYRKAESHVQGTLRMGTGIEDSVVDRAQIHHGIRNLMAVGTAVFPTCPPAPPSLTIAALSLRAADLLLA